MTQPRRAAYPPIDASVDVTVDVAAKPRRGAGSSLLVKRALAPTAVVGLLAVTSTLAFLPFGAGIDAGSTSVADPQAQGDVHLGVSRNSARVALAGPTAAPSPTMTPSPTPAPSPSSTPSVTVATPSPVVSASPVATASPTATATPSVPAKQLKLGEKVGVRYAASALNVRKGPGTDFDVIVSLADGKALTITDQVFEGWQQVNLKGKAGWVKASYLTDDAPASEPKVSQTSVAAAKKTETKSANTAETPSDSPTGDSTGDSSGDSTGGVDTSSCAKVERITGGLTSRADGVARAVCNAFPAISSYGGRRVGDSGFHGTGRAIDIMVSGEAGWKVARWARANASALGITEVLYSRKIWTTQRSGEGWRSFSDRGGVTANHYDHVHISVR